MGCSADECDGDGGGRRATLPLHLFFPFPLLLFIGCIGCSISFHLISPHLILSHFTSSYLISFHLISSHLISLCIESVRTYLRQNRDGFSSAVWHLILIIPTSLQSLHLISFCYISSHTIFFHQCFFLQHLYFHHSPLLSYPFLSSSLFPSLPFPSLPLIS